jgi:hypothetical protein
MKRINQHSWYEAIAVATVLCATVPVNYCLSQAQEPNRQLIQSGATSTNPAKRVALVIGNGAYANAPVLKNPPNDARDMAKTLRELGFDVTSGINVNQKEMKRLVREFGQKLKSGGSGLFYYAGHGVQSKGRNFLIPTDADIQSEAEVEDSAVDVNLVLSYMDEAQNGLNIVILDACRNNPFARSFRSASGGLAQVDAPTGTLIAYATAPGHVASDGTGQNGLYTSELLKQMRVSGLSATDMFMRVRAEIMKQTGSKQVPWEASSLVGSFYFTGAGAATALNNAPTTSRDDAAAFELTYWDSIKNSNDPADFRSYMEQYPSGKFIALARNRLKTLETNKRSTSTSSITPTGKQPGAILSSLSNSGVATLPREACFRSDPGAASTDWKSHYTWAQGQDATRLKAAIEQKLDLLFGCRSITDEQAFDDFAAISVIIARYVPDAACFNGDRGAVDPDPAGHKNWANVKGRGAALNNLKAKAMAAVDCLDSSEIQDARGNVVRRSKRFSYYADVSVLAAGGKLK